MCGRSMSFLRTGVNITLMMSVILFGLFTALLLVGVVVEESHGIKLLRSRKDEIRTNIRIGNPVWEAGP